MNREENWQHLHEALIAIQQKKTSQLSYQQLYKYAYDLVQQKHGDFLYKKLQQALQNLIQYDIYELQRNNEQKVLEALNQLWKKIKMMLTTINHIFLYLNKKYCIDNKCKPVYVLGIELFGKLIFQNGTFECFIKQLLNMLNQESHLKQSTQTIDLQLVQESVLFIKELGTKVRFIEQSNMGQFGNNVQTFEIYESLHIYEKYFDSRLVEQKNIIYKELKEVVQLKNYDVEKIIELIKNELEIIKNKEFYEEQTRQQLIQKLLEQMIKQNRQVNVMMMIDQDRLEEFRQLLNFVEEDRPTVDNIIGEVGKAIYDLGVKYYNDLMIEETQQNEKSMPQFNYQLLIKKILGLILKCKQIQEISQEVLVGQYKNSFKEQSMKNLEKFVQNTKQFQQLQIVVRSNLKNSMNSYSQQLIISLIKYLDYNYKKQFKNKSDSEIMGILRNGLMVFQQLNDKDIFLAQYQKCLTRRLINYNVNFVGEEYEKYFVKLIKEECGGMFTSKLDKMFEDLQISRSVNQEYSKYKIQHNFGIDLEVQILSQGIWPLQNIYQPNFPNLMEQSIQEYKKFYYQKFPQRKIEWISQLGLIDLRFNVSKNKKKELLVSIFQMLILYQFNQYVKISQQEMIRLTGIELQELNRNVIPLVDLQILKMGCDNNQYWYSVNDDFTHKNYKIKVPVLKNKQKKTEVIDKEQKDMNILERKQNMEIHIIRIMKRLKEIDHQSLCNELLKQIEGQFVASQQFIKSCIESLIDREYLERKSNNSYVYLP